MSWRTEGLSACNDLIVIPWNQSVESYVALGAQVECKRPIRCPGCDCSDLIFWGRRKRFATDGKQSFVLFLRRVRCRGCGKTHTILPAFLLKNQAHLGDLILRVLIAVFGVGKGSRTAAEELGLARSTVRRWCARFKEAAAAHYRRFLFLRHNLLPNCPSPPAGDYPKAALALLAELFGVQSDRSRAFARWVSSATFGRLLFDQPAMAP